MTFVNQTVEEISAEFTPEENGYYSLKLNDMINYDVEILIGGEFCGIRELRVSAKRKNLSL